MAKKKAKKSNPMPSRKKHQLESLNQFEAVESANVELITVCRLCETKDGPFLNIFDPDKVTEKKIEELMPFVIAGNDALPQKICFRCSAKVEELYEFIQKCVKTQTSLCSSIGKRGPLLKTKPRYEWKEKLNKCNISIDEMCNASIRKVMDSNKNLPIHLDLIDGDEEKSLLKKEKSQSLQKETTSCENTINKGPDSDLKTLKLSVHKIIQNTIDRVQHDSAVNSQDKLNADLNKMSKNQIELRSSWKETWKPIKNKSDADSDVKEESVNVSITKKVEPEKKPPFNIMDHVSKIKVNGVGILFQCKLCNKNFLKMEVVENHGCAKNCIPKTDFVKHIPSPQPPKAPTVKFIKIDGNLKKNKEVHIATKPPEVNEPEKHESISKQIVNQVPKAKPKIGPASKVKRPPSPKLDVTLPSLPVNPVTQGFQFMQLPVSPDGNIAPSVMPVINFPGLSNKRYSLVPGPSNTFTLVEDANYVRTPINVAMTNNVTMPANVMMPTSFTTPTNFTIPANFTSSNVSMSSNVTPPNNVLISTNGVPNNVHVPANVQLPTNSTNPTVTTPKIAEMIDHKTDPSPNTEKPLVKKFLVKKYNLAGPKSKKLTKPLIPEIIDLDDLDQKPGQPYPVGLFKTAANSEAHTPTTSGPPAFTTPAMKKQLYTVVQTGNPSKLVISTKPVQTAEEPPKKRPRREKHEDASNKQPFRVTLEDTAPPKDPELFSFINVDPLLQPSYVLPTDNIQESQISTSTQVVNTARQKENENSCKIYSCNMCGSTFTREKKLLTHIQSHYSKMDKEDNLREKMIRRKGKS